jgi:hypothetical protein
MTPKRTDMDNPHLCKFQFPDGRFCGFPAVPAMDGFCRTHGSRPRVPAQPKLSSKLFAFSADPPSEDDVHRALAQVFLSLADHRISPRRAATFGYLAQLLLTSKSTTRAKLSTEAIYQLWRRAVRETYAPPVPPALARPSPPQP